MSKLTDALNNFFASAKTTTVDDATLLEGKTPTQVADSNTKTSVGLSNAQNWPVGTVAEHTAGTAGRYAGSDRFFRALESRFQSWIEGLGNVNVQIKTRLGSGNTPVAVRNEGLIHPLHDFTQYSGYASMLRANSKCKVEGYRIVNFEDQLVHTYTGGAWVDTTFASHTGNNSLRHIFPWNSIYVSSYMKHTYYIDSAGTVRKIYN